MLNNKITFSTIFLLLLLLASPAQSAIYGFSGELELWVGDPSTLIGGPNPTTGFIDFDTQSGAGSGGELYPTNQYWASSIFIHDINITKNIDDTFTTTMLFDWGANINVSATVLTEITNNLNGTLSIISLDGNGDGVPGYPINNGPYSNGSFGITGTLTAVPLPASLWLFLSGLFSFSLLGKKPINI